MAAETVWREIDELAASAISSISGLPSARAEIAEGRDGEIVPASDTQELAYRRHAAADDKSIFNIVASYRISSAIDVSALQSAFDRLVRVNAVLRSALIRVDGQVMQCVRKLDHCPIHIIDEMPDRDAARIVRDEWRRPFDLASAPLVRMILIRSAAPEWRLALIAHSAAADDWSLSLLLSQFWQSATKCGAQASAADAASYADHALWIRSAECSEILEANLEFWRTKLGRVVTRSFLPDDPAQRRPGEGLVTIVLQETIAEKIRMIARGEGCPPVAVLAALFGVLLYRYSGAEDIVLGYVLAGRAPRRASEMVGAFEKELGLRLRLLGDAPFVDAVRVAKHEVLEGHAHQTVSITGFVDEFGRPHGAQSPRLFQCAIRYRELPGLSLPPSIQGVLELVELSPVPGDLLLDLTPEPSGAIRCCFRYCSTAFEEQTVLRFAEQFLALAVHATEHPLTCLSRLRMQSPNDRQATLDRGNDTSRDFGPFQAVGERFSLLSREQPDAIALISTDRAVTYGQLDQMSDAIADLLLRHGVQAEVLVGVCMESCVELVISLLGILKAGGAYLPIDPTYPPDRMAHIITDSGMLILLTKEAVRSLLPETQIAVFCVDRDSSAPSTAKIGARAPNPEDLAYVIYTSGTGGRPKGVQVSQRSLFNHYWSFREATGISAADRCALFFNASFDGAIEGIFGPLLTGASLVVSNDRAIAFDELNDLIERHQLTFLDFTSSYWNAWLELLQASNNRIPASIRKVVIGGETVRVNQLRRWNNLIGDRDVELYITYGPTEATVIATSMRYRRPELHDTFVHRDGFIGKPMGNVRIYVLDGHLQPVAEGVPGELFISGAGVARGYRNAPGLTADRFVVDPYSGRAGERMYRSGDIVRRLADGTLQFIGRSDNQIKLRGFRIELSEIERCLASHQSVRQAYVTITNAAPGADGRIVAFAMCRGGGSVHERTLELHLKRQLPGYMIPSQICVLDAFPLNLSGKTDRAALLSKLVTAVPETRAGEEAHGAVTQAVVDAFCSVLGRVDVAVHENFFKIGGHSLLVLPFLSQIKKRFGVNLPMRTLFLNPTPAKFAKVIEGAMDNESHEVPRAREAIDQPAAAAAQY